MNKQKAVNELKKLRYEVQSARVKDSVEFELEILEEEYEVIKALSDDVDLTPIDFGHFNDINYNDFKASFLLGNAKFNIGYLEENNHIGNNSYFKSDIKFNNN